MGKGRKEKGSRRKPSLGILIILSIMVIVIPVDCWFIHSARQTQNIIMQDARGNIRNVGNIYRERLSQRIESTNNYMYDQMSVGGILYSLALVDDRDTYIVRANQSVRSAREHMSYYRDMDVINIYSSRYGYGATRTYESLQLMPMSSYFQRLRGEDPELRTVWYTEEVEGTLWMLRFYNYQDVYYAVGINLTDILKDVKSDVIYEDAEVSFDKEHLQETDDVIGASVYCDFCGYYLNVRVPKQSVLAGLSVLQRYNVLVSIFSLAIIPLLWLVLRKLVMQPMKTTTDAMLAIREDPDTRIMKRADTREFDAVFTTFNSMADEVVHLRIKNYEEELGRQRLEMENLELQMNPHFLMNTFNLIFNLAQMKEYTNIQKMVLYLSEYFRYLNGKNRTGSTVKEEISLTRKYMETAQIQYIGRFEVSIDVDPALDDFVIPSLLLHNFAENFIKHGICFDRICHLSITGRKEEKDAVFEIKDDGRGMKQEMAAAINAGNFDFGDGRHHYGMRNNYMRVKYLYHGKGSIRVTPGKERGLTVTIRLPLESEEVPAELPEQQGERKKREENKRESAR